MTRSARDPRAASDEDIARVAIAGLAICLSLGLLLCGSALPLTWMPGQMVALLVSLAFTPVAAVWRTMRLTHMSGVPADDFARRTQFSWLVVEAALLVAMPVAEARYFGPSGAIGSLQFNGAIGLSLALCMLAAGMAATFTLEWARLLVQVWEVGGDARTIEAANEHRDAIVRALRGQWAMGAAAMALAVFAHQQWAASQVMQAWLTLALFVLYIGAGLAFLGLAARTRQVTYWQLTGYRVADEVAGEWNRLGVSAAVIALLACGLLWVFRLFDAAHLLLVSTLNPLGSFLKDLLAHLFDVPWRVNTAPHAQMGSQAHQRGLVFPQASLRHTTTNGFWRAVGNLISALEAFIHQNWPLLVMLLALLVVARIYLTSRSGGKGSDLWRAMIGLLLRNLRSLMALFTSWGRRAAIRVLGAALTASTSRARALARRRGPDIDGMPPRQAVIAIYLAVLAHAARRGHPRRLGQTPAEYGDELVERAPVVREDVHGLTGLFVAVRYGARPVGPDDVSRARTQWQSIRKLLRRRRT